jgi:hypothetical protein
MDLRSLGNCLGAAIVSALLLDPFVPVEAQIQKPNIILIVSDDFGYGDSSPYGAPMGEVRDAGCPRQTLNVWRMKA